ncbi:MAG: hypothetical protein U0939_07230 [Pirellulales bacterium]
MTLPQELKLAKEINRKEILLSVVRLPQTGRVFCGASDGKVYSTDIEVEKPEFQEWPGHSSYVTGLALAGKTLVSGSYDGRLIWRDAESGAVIRDGEAHAKWIRKVAASPDGRWVASVADDMVCRVWDAVDGKLVHELRGHAVKTPQHFPSMLYACVFSADSARLATVDRVGHVVVWDAADGKPAATLEVPEMYTWDPKQRIHAIGGPRSVAFSPDGKLLAVGGMGQVGNIDHLEGKARVEILDWQKGERTHEFPGEQFKGLVERLVFSPAGDWLLGAGGDNGGFVQLFDLAGNRVAKQEKSATHIHDAALNEAANQLVVAAHGRLQVWQLQ